MPNSRYVARIAGEIAELAPSHEVFDLTNGSPARDIDPLALALGSGDSGELARCRPSEITAGEGLPEVGQAFECFGYSEALFYPSLAVAEDTLDILCEASEPKVVVDAGTKGPQERATFVPVELPAGLDHP